MPDPKVNTPPVAPQIHKVLPPSTTEAETNKYLIMADKETRKSYVRVKDNPEGFVFQPINVTAQLNGISLDRGERIDRFFVLKFKKNKDETLTAVSVHDDPEASFFITCKEFCEGYKVAV